MNPIDYVVAETERQSGTMREAIGMYLAWQRACRYHYVSMGAVMSESAIKSWANMINGNREYRLVPAVFNQGRPAVHHSSIPNAMAGLVAAMNDPGLNVTADYFTREFLNIHPFADGNGRVGSLLWNWLSHTLHDPEPMPYFFGED